jgi:hypothetical protein
LAQPFEQRYNFPFVIETMKVMTETDCKNPITGKPSENLDISEPLHLSRTAGWLAVGTL